MISIAQMGMMFMFKKLREKIKFLRLAYEHRNCTSKDFVVPINLIRKEIIPKKYHAEKIVSFEDSNDATKMYLVKKSIAEDIAHILFHVLNYKTEKIDDKFYRISADVILGDENEFSK